MDTLEYQELTQYKSYKRFVKNRKISACLVIIFGLLITICFILNKKAVLNNWEQSLYIIFIIVLVVIFFIAICDFINAFFRKPKCYIGIISDIKENEYINNGDFIKYGVNIKDKKRYCLNLDDYNNPRKRYSQLKIGDKVMCFTYNSKDYFLTLLKK